MMCAIRLLVDQIVNVVYQMVRLFALVCLHLTEVPRRANQNALLAPNVL